MERKDFQELVNSAIKAAVEKEGISLTSSEERYIRRRLEVYDGQLEQREVSNYAIGMDKLWEYFLFRVGEVIRDEEIEGKSSVFDSERLKKVTDAIQKHWLEIRKCGEIFDKSKREVSAGKGRLS